MIADITIYMRDTDKFTESIINETAAISLNFEGSNFRLYCHESNIEALKNLKQVVESAVSSLEAVKDLKAAIRKEVRNDLGIRKNS